MVTHCFQVVLHDVPRGLHHFEHHVVLDVLHKVEHALSESERSSKPVWKHSMIEDDWPVVWMSPQAVEIPTTWENVGSTDGSPCCWSRRCTTASRRVCSKTCVWTASGSVSGLSWRRWPREGRKQSVNTVSRLMAAEGARRNSSTCWWWGRGAISQCSRRRRPRGRWEPRLSARRWWWPSPVWSRLPARAAAEWWRHEASSRSEQRGGETKEVERRNNKDRRRRLNSSAHLEVVFERVCVGGAHPQRQLQQSFQSGGNDVVYGLLQLFFCQVHEMHEEVTLVH